VSLRGHENEAQRASPFPSPHRGRVPFRKKRGAERVVCACCRGAPPPTPAGFLTAHAQRYRAAFGTAGPSLTRSRLSPVLNMRGGKSRRADRLSANRPESGPSPCGAMNDGAEYAPSCGGCPTTRTHGRVPPASPTVAHGLLGA
jgi:hypothetical protein